jgi:succinoglycan biosynthesis transport protein ExoP
MRKRSKKLTPAAAFDNLRDGICLRIGGLPKVVVVTSARRGEGRSSIAAGLACAFARIGDRPVVLADFDFRRPALHAAFGCPIAPGASDILRGGAELAAALQPVESGTVLLLSAGGGSQDAIALMSSPAFAALLAELQSRSVAVIDAPPLESGAEMEILAPAASAVVLVICADRTAEREAQAAVARLSAAGGAPLLGVVLNQARRGDATLSGGAAAAEPAASLG